MIAYLPKRYPLRALIIGLCLSSAWPPVNFFPLLWLGWALLLHEIRNSSGIRDAMAKVYLPMVIWNLGTTYWLMMATVPGGIAAILANAVVLSVPLGLAYPLLQRTNPPWIGVLGAASVWLLMEWIHTRWELAWPWLQLGNALAAWPWMYQWISYTGVFGLSFWIFVTSAYLPIDDTWKSPRAWKAFSLLAFIPVLISIALYGFTSPKAAGYQEVTVVQPNYDSYLPMGGYADSVTPLMELLQLTDSVRTETSRLVIWPENALMDDIYSGYPQEAEFILNNAIREQSYTLITGATYMELFPVDTREPLVRRFGNGVPFKAYNTALKWSPNDTVQIYHKRHLVPLVETIPWLRYLDALDVFGIQFPQLNSYHRGMEAVNFTTPIGSVPAIICYDSVFPNWVRTTVRDGATMVAIITNDGWWGHSSGHIQHFQFARLRAVETGRSVVRSANNGISGLIDAQGQVLTSTPYWVRTGFTAKVPVYDTMTFYVKYGDWWIGVCLILLASSLRISLRNRRKVLQ